MDLIVPFIIPAPGGNPIGKVQVRPQQGMTKGEIQLVVISGGPVFLMEGDVDAQAALDRTAGANGRNVDFDLASTINEPTCVSKENFESLITLVASVATVGYIRYRAN
jgi:hypothetical protein